MPTDVNAPSLTGALVNSSRDGTPAGPGGRLGKDEFLRLLTTQLRYQDPLDPMDGKDMASDLAQFSGLEQLLGINEQLAAQQGQYDALVVAMQNGIALNTIGKTVVVEGDKVMLAKNDKGEMEGRITTDITTRGKATLKLYDKSGKEVGSRSLGYVSAGRQEFDVALAAAKITTEGGYAYKVTVTDATTGKELPQKTYTVGKIDGMTYGDDGKARLLMGPFTIDYEAIIRILS